MSAGSFCAAIGASIVDMIRDTRITAKRMGGRF
jgi:hypothetical protein